MEITCNIIRDLLPLYAEDMVSQDSKKMVDDHLCGCDACTKELGAIQKAPKVPLEVDVKSLKRVGNTIRRRRLLAALAAVMTVLTIGVTLYTYLFAPYYLTAEEAVEDVYLKEDGTLIIDYARGITGRSGWGHMTPDNWGILCHTTRYDWYQARQKDAEIADLTEEELKRYIADLYDVEECTERQWNRFFGLSEDDGTIRTKSGEIIHGTIAELMLNEESEWIQKPADRNHWYVNPSNGDAEALLWDAGKDTPTALFTSVSNLYAIVFYGSLVLTVLLFLCSRHMKGIGKELATRGAILLGSVAFSSLLVTNGKLITVLLYNWKELIIAESLFVSLTALLWYQLFRYRQADKGV